MAALPAGFRSAGLLGGRRAVVTGASRGIGAAVAERFAAEGASVALVARTLEHHEHLAGSLTATQQRCLAYGATVECIVADLADGDDRARVISSAASLLGGPVEILVNNAAAAIYQPLADFPLKRRRLTFEVNVHAPFDLIEAALPAMREAREGWIVNLSSATAHATESDPTMAVYGASKAALNRLTIGYARELRGAGIRVNAVAPRGAVQTEGVAALLGDSLRPELFEPMEAMVEAVLLLARAPENMTAGVHTSLELLAQTGTTVMSLDGRTAL